MHFKTSETNVLCGHNPIGIAASSAKSFRTSSGTVIFVIVVIRGALHVSHICACEAAGCGLPVFSSLAWPRSAHYRHAVRLVQASHPRSATAESLPRSQSGSTRTLITSIWLYGFLPTLRPSIDGYARRPRAMSQFAEILNELQTRGDKTKVMQLFGHLERNFETIPARCATIH